MKKILIIEDDLAISDKIFNYLKDLKKFNIQQCTHGEQGLSAINVFRPDLIILDIMLPEIDGFEICKKINEMPISVQPKIILLTVLTPLLNNMESNWLDNTGARALLTKPVDLHKLSTKINEILDV